MLHLRSNSSFQNIACPAQNSIKGDWLVLMILSPRPFCSLLIGSLPRKKNPLFSNWMVGAARFHSACCRCFCRHIPPMLCCFSLSLPLLFLLHLPFKLHDDKPLCLCFSLLNFVTVLDLGDFVVIIAVFCFGVLGI